MAARGTGAAVPQESMDVGSNDQAALLAKFDAMQKRIDELEARDRLSREQEASTDSSVHDVEAESWEETTLLEHPSLKPRDGMVQMWVRFSLAGRPDRSNVVSMTAPKGVGLTGVGWTPRSLDTVPKDVATSLRVEVDGEGVIAYNDVMLCEMPVAAYEARRRAPIIQAERMRDAVELNRMRVRESGSGMAMRPGGTEARIQTGRRAVVDAD